MPAVSRPRDPLLLVFVLLVAVAFGELLYPWLASDGFEVTRLRDDAYYQFAVARNFATGDGFTLDRVHSAGGVQFLWTVLLVPFAWIDAARLPDYAILLGSLLLAGTGGLAFLLARRYVPERLALLLAALLVSRPELTAEAMNGQETALALLALFGWLLAVLPVPVVEEQGIQPDEDGVWRLAASAPFHLPVATRAIWTLTMLLPWVRTDLVLFPFGYIVVHLVAKRFGRVADEDDRERVFTLAQAFVASGVVYLLGQKLLFGRWLPSSGLAIPWVFQDAFFRGQPSFGQVLRQLWWFVRPCLLGGPYALAGLVFGAVIACCVLDPIAMRRRSLPLVLVFVAWLFGASNLEAVTLGAALLMITAGLWIGQLARREGRLLYGLVVASVLLVALHTVIRWAPRTYYFMPIAVPGFLGLVLLLDHWLNGRHLLMVLPEQRRISLAVLVLAAFAVMDPLPRLVRFPWQAEMRFAAQNVEHVIGRSFGIASFNAGQLAWWYPGPVRDCDGVVDGASTTALRSGKLLDWLAREKMDFLLDTPRQVARDDPDPHYPHASGRYLGPGTLEPFVAFDLPGVGGEHEGTECQVLYGLNGEHGIELSRDSHVLARSDAGVVVFLTGLPDGAPLIAEVDGRDTEIRLSKRARAIGRIVTRLAGKSGRLRAGGNEVLRW